MQDFDPVAKTDRCFNLNLYYTRREPVVATHDTGTSPCTHAERGIVIGAPLMGKLEMALSYKCPLTLSN